MTESPATQAAGGDASKRAKNGLKPGSGSSNGSVGSPRCCRERRRGRPEDEEEDGDEAEVRGPGWDCGGAEGASI